MVSRDDKTMPILWSAEITNMPETSTEDRKTGTSYFTTYWRRHQSSFETTLTEQEMTVKEDWNTEPSH